MQKNGVYYFSRRVPSNLKQHFKCQRFVRCLHTKSEPKAFRLSHELSSRLENIWDRQRLELIDLMPMSSIMHSAVAVNEDTKSIMVSDAFELYLKLKAANRPKTFGTHAVRNLGYLTDCIGDINLTALRPQHGGVFRDYLIAKKLSTSSIKRVFSTIRAVINLSKSEMGLTMSNPFSTTFIPQVGVAKNRSSIPAADIARIQTLCLNPSTYEILTEHDGQNPSEHHTFLSHPLGDP
tara:strand:- start:146 stop:853 length:708 start_codon:yes stop_codon:yes gene_type:complete